MSTLTFESDLYKYQKQSSGDLDEFDSKINDIYNDKHNKQLCQFWGCHESCHETDSELDEQPELCDFHEKIIADVFQTKLTAFITNESDMLTKIKNFMSDEANLRLIDHLSPLFDDKCCIYIGQHKKFGVRMEDQIYLVDNVIGLFMSYIKTTKSWLISESHLTEWLTTEKTTDIVDELTSMASFTTQDGVSVYYIKSMTKENMIESICHHIANEIRGVYEKQEIRIE